MRRAVEGGLFGFGDVTGQLFYWGIPTTPDARGRLFVDVDRLVGPFAYVNLLDLQADP